MSVPTGMTLSGVEVAMKQLRIPRRAIDRRADLTSTATSMITLPLGISKTIKKYDDELRPYDWLMNDYFESLEKNFGEKKAKHFLYEVSLKWTLPALLSRYQPLTQSKVDHQLIATIWPPNKEAYWAKQFGVRRGRIENEVRTAKFLLLWHLAQRKDPGLAREVELLFRKHQHDQEDEMDYQKSDRLIWEIEQRLEDPVRHSRGTPANLSPSAHLSDEKSFQFQTPRPASR